MQGTLSEQRPLQKSVRAAAGGGAGGEFQLAVGSISKGHNNGLSSILSLVLFLGLLHHILPKPLGHFDS